MTGKVRVKLTRNEFGPGRVALVKAAPPPLLPVDPFNMVDEDAARQMIKARLKAAGKMLLNDKLPSEMRALTAAVSAMPDIIHDRSDYAAWEKPKLRPAKPGARQTDELNEVLGWLLWLGPVERPIVHGCMVASLRKVAAVDPAGRSHEDIRRTFDRGITHILGRLLIEHTLSAKSR